MNYSRFASRNPQQGLPQGVPQRNFGSDIHEFMEGLGKIAQIMYTSIPVIEFAKIAIKYSWKFCEFLGTNVLTLIGVVKEMKKPELVMESLWNSQPKWRSMAKLSSALAVGVVFLCLLMSKPELEDEWNRTSEEKPEMRGFGEVRSVEDRPCAEEGLEQYEDYAMY